MAKESKKWEETGTGHYEGKAYEELQHIGNQPDTQESLPAFSLIERVSVDDLIAEYSKTGAKDHIHRPSMEYFMLEKMIQESGNITAQEAYQKLCKTQSEMYPLSEAKNLKFNPVYLKANQNFEYFENFENYLLLRADGLSRRTAHFAATEILSTIAIYGHSWEYRNTIYKNLLKVYEKEGIKTAPSKEIQNLFELDDKRNSYQDYLQ